MAKGNIVRWITIKGRRVPIYEDGSMGGFMEGKQRKVDPKEDAEMDKELKKTHPASTDNDEDDDEEEGYIPDTKIHFSTGADGRQYITNIPYGQLDDVLEAGFEPWDSYESKPVEGLSKQEIYEGWESGDIDLSRERKKKASGKDDKIKSNIGVSHDDPMSVGNEVIRIRDELDSGKSTTTSNKEIADMYKNSPKKAFDVKDNGDGTYEISKKRTDAVAVVSHKAKAPSKKEPVPETKEVLNARHALRLEAQRPGGPNQKALETLQKEYDRAVEKARAEAKSIKVGDKEVAVNKTASTHQEREVKRLVGDKYGEAWAERRIDSYSSSKLKQIAKAAGIKNISTMTDNELRKKLLAMWKRG